MAVFVRENVVQPVFGVDYFFGEVDGAVVEDRGGLLLLVLRRGGGDAGGGSGSRPDGFASPVGAAGGRFEGFGPVEVDAAGWGGEAGYGARGYGGVEEGEKGGC